MPLDPKMSLIWIPECAGIVRCTWPTQWPSQYDREDDRRGGVLRIEGADVRPEALARAAVGDLRQDRVAVRGARRTPGMNMPTVGTGAVE